MTMPVIELCEVSRRYDGGPPALHEASLTVRPGEAVAILGPSGSGKSTLLNLVAGLDRPDTGTVTVDGVRVDRLGEAGSALYRRSKIGMVFQFFNLLDDLTVTDNVVLPARLAGMARGRAAHRAVELLELLGIDRHARSYPGRLSGGERQRVAVARALMNRPAAAPGRRTDRGPGHGRRTGRQRAARRPERRGPDHCRGHPRPGSGPVLHEPDRPDRRRPDHRGRPVALRRPGGRPMSALGKVVRSGVGRRRVQTLVIGLATMMAVAASVLGGSLLVVSGAPFDDAFAEQHGAHLALQFDAGEVSAGQLSKSGEAAGSAVRPDRFVRRR